MVRGRVAATPRLPREYSAESCDNARADEDRRSPTIERKRRPLIFVRSIALGISASRPAAVPRPVPAEYPRGSRGVAAATRPRTSTSRPQLRAHASSTAVVDQSRPAKTVGLLRLVLGGRRSSSVLKISASRPAAVPRSVPTTAGSILKALGDRPGPRARRRPRSGRRPRPRDFWPPRARARRPGARRRPRRRPRAPRFFPGGRRCGFRAR